MHQLARWVRDLENVLARVEAVSLSRVPAQVTVGTRVRYRLDDDRHERSCALAGWDDGEPAAQRVRYNSPLGAALVGAVVDEEREVVLAGRARSVLVLAGRARSVLVLAGRARSVLVLAIERAEET